MLRYRAERVECMAMKERTLAEIKARGVGRGAATGEAAIRRQTMEDGQDPEAAPPPAAGTLARTVRRRLGMTQAQFAEAIGVPVATLRNWEQGRVAPDPAARALLRILDREPEVALRALGQR